MKLGVLVAAVLLVAGGAVSCGGGDDGGGGDAAPSTKEFCGALAEFKDTSAAADPTTDVKAYVKTIKDGAAKLAKVGTPDGMPSDAKQGFDLTVDTIKALSDDATVDDLAGIDVSSEDQKKLDALRDYVAKTCPGLADDSSTSPSSSASRSPTSSPSG